MHLADLFARYRLTETPEADDLVLQAINYFGVTRDYNEAGYIVSYKHRTMLLDFSGKHEHNDYEKQNVEYKRGVYPMHVLKRNRKFDDLRGQRYTDHREIVAAVPLAAQGTDGMYEFMRRTGALRVKSDGIGVAAVPPMSAIVVALRGHREKNGSEPFMVDVLDQHDRDYSRAFSVRHGWEAIQKYIAAVLNGHVTEGHALVEMPEMIRQDELDNDAVYKALRYVAKARYTKEATVGSLTITRAVLDPGETIFAVWHIDEPVAYAMVTKKALHGIPGLRIKSLGTIPEMRRMGIAKMLYQHILRNGASLWSDSAWTPQGRDFWDKMARSPDVDVYEVSRYEQPPTFTKVEQVPKNTARLARYDYLMVKAGTQMPR